MNFARALLPAATLTCPCSYLSACNVDTGLSPAAPGTTHPLVEASQVREQLGIVSECPFRQTQPFRPISSRPRFIRFPIARALAPRIPDFPGGESRGSGRPGRALRRIQMPQIHTEQTFPQRERGVSEHALRIIQGKGAQPSIPAHVACVAVCTPLSPMTGSHARHRHSVDREHSYTCPDASAVQWPTPEAPAASSWCEPVNCGRGA